MLSKRKLTCSFAPVLTAAIIASAGCGGGSESVVSDTEDSRASVASSAKPEPTLELDAPDGAFPLVWVRRGARIEIRTEPNGGRVVEVVDKRTEYSSPTVFSVVKRAGEWAGVATPFLPNGRLGWLRLDPERLRAGWTRLALQVDLSERRAALHEGDEILRSFTVTVGAPGYETPTGRFAITDTFRGDLNRAAYGCCALALTATQPTVPSGWLGGNRIAIHGTSGPLGVAASHGCIRARDDEVGKLIDTVPLGAPVFIRA